MGTGIAEVTAAAGCAVSVVEVSRERAADSRAQLGASDERAAARGKMTSEATQRLVGRVGIHADLHVLE